MLSGGPRKLARLVFCFELRRVDTHCPASFSLLEAIISRGTCQLWRYTNSNAPDLSVIPIASAAATLWSSGTWKAAKVAIGETDGISMGLQKRKEERRRALAELEPLLSATAGCRNCGSYTCSVLRLTLQLLCSISINQDNLGKG